MRPQPLTHGRLASALLDRDRDPPAGLGRTAGRIAVHRHTIAATLTQALGTSFPVCRRLVGEAFFRAMAAVFIELSPPRSPVLMTWGCDLPAFLERFPPARSVPYLADVARLEIARSQAYHAAEAEPLGAGALAAVAPEAWGRVRLALHPSVRVVSSPHPIVSIWAAHAGGDTLPSSARPARGEEALIARPGAAVETRLLPAGGAAFIEGLQRHGCLARALGDAAAPGQDGARCLSVLVEARLIVGVEVPAGG